MPSMRTAIPLLLAILISCTPLRAQPAGGPQPTPPPAGMAEFQRMKYGFFVHYVWGGDAYSATVNRDGSMPAGLDDLADRFDAKRFADDLAAMGIEYVVFTAFHAGMNVLYPSQAMEKWRPGHSARRDLLGDLIKACKAKNIAVLFYTHPRDGHDFSAGDQARTGWAPTGSADPDFKKFDRQKWNDFINDIYGELVDRYGNDIVGLYLDEGSGAADSQRVVDYPRLRKTITAKHPHLMMMQNDYGSLYSCDIGNQEIFYGKSFASPDGDSWNSYKIPISIVVGSIFWAAFPEGKDAPAQKSAKVGFNKWIHYSPEAMFRYTVLQAGTNTDGGGVLWAAGPYPGGGWETGVLDRMKATGKLVQAVAPSIKGTYPSTSYPTAPGKRIADLVWGVATQSPDGRTEFLHVLKAPAGSKSLSLPPPADGKRFSRGFLLRNSKPVTLKQTSAGLELALPAVDSWDRLDTVIALEVAPGSPPQDIALWRPFRASSLDGKSYPMLAVDGNPSTAWRSAPDDPAPSCYVDLGEVRPVSRIEIQGSLPSGAVLEAADNFEFSNARRLAVDPGAKTQELKIVRATYGAGQKSADVTGKLRAAAASGALSIKVENSLVGRDPAPNITKELKVEYILDGKPETATVGEDGTLTLGTAPAWAIELPEAVPARFLRISRKQPGVFSIAGMRVFGPAQ